MNVLNFVKTEATIKNIKSRGAGSIWYKTLKNNTAQDIIYNSNTYSTKKGLNPDAYER